MGFSITGLLITVFVFGPNLLFVFLPPRNVPGGLKDAGLHFTVLERIGQAGCIIIPIISGNSFSNSGMSIWPVLAGLCILAYWSLWARYVVKGRDFSLCFEPILHIPVPMAVFPVCAFGFAAIWGRSVYLGAGAAILAVGHFVNSWHTYKSVKNEQ